MSVEINDNTFFHRRAPSDAESTFRISPNGILGVAGADHTVDVMEYHERVALARWLLKDLNWGPNQTIASFAAGIGGPNEQDDRLRFINSFGDSWIGTKYHEGLRIWIVHQDASKLDGVWDERVRKYYTDRGYPR